MIRQDTPLWMKTARKSRYRFQSVANIKIIELLEEILDAVKSGGGRA